MAELSPSADAASAAAHVFARGRPAVVFAAAGRAWTPDAPRRSGAVFVDARRGDDENDGTAAHPFKTITRALRVTSPASIKALYLRCGTLWREPLVVRPAQFANDSVITGYGPECGKERPVLSGADDFSGGWKRDAALWWRTVPEGVPKIEQMFIDGEPLRVARWPQSGTVPVAQGSGASKQRLVLAQMPPGPTAGATVQVQSLPWLVETRRVAGEAERGQPLALDEPLRFDVHAGAGVVLQDRLWMLDAPGEFFHDRAAGRVYLRPPAHVADVNRTRVEGSVRNVPLSVQDMRGLEISGLEVMQGNRDGISVVNSGQTRLVQLRSHHNAGAGIFLAQWTPGAPAPIAASVRDSEVADNGERGIDAGQMSRVQVLDNRVLRTGIGHHAGPALAAIQAGPGSRIEGNVVDGAAYGGIAFSGAEGSVVQGNLVANYCMRLTDCAGLYAWNGRGSVARALPQHSTVTGNVVLWAGLPDSEGAALGGHDVLAGLYLDDFVRGAQVRDNTFYGVPIGIFLHNASANHVQNNRIWLPQRVAVWVSADMRDEGSLEDNVIASNDVVLGPETRPAQVAWHWQLLGGKANGAAQARFESNRVLSVGGSLQHYATRRGQGQAAELTAEQWRQQQPADGSPELRRSAAADGTPVLVHVGAAARDVQCADLGWATPCSATDAAGQSVQLPLHLLPYSTRLLFGRPAVRR